LKFGHASRRAINRAIVSLSPLLSLSLSRPAPPRPPPPFPFRLINYAVELKTASRFPRGRTCACNFRADNEDLLTEGGTGPISDGSELPRAILLPSPRDRRGGCLFSGCTCATVTAVPTSAINAADHRPPRAIPAVVSTTTRQSRLIMAGAASYP